MLRGLSKFPKRFFSEFKNTKLNYDFFEYEPYKFKEQQQKLYGNFTEEELFGTKNLGFESPKYRREVRALYWNILFITVLIVSYGYSFLVQNRLWNEIHNEWIEK